MARKLQVWRDHLSCAELPYAVPSVGDHAASAMMLDRWGAAKGSLVEVGVRQGQRGAIYVDDSGNPGVESGSDFLPASRKSWTAVIVPSPVAEDVEAVMRILIAGVRQDYSAEELHFTDIWSGAGAWAGVGVSERAEMIQMVAQIMERFQLPVVHQTISDNTLNDHPKFRQSLKEQRSGDWVLDDVGQFGLLMLASQVTRHLRQMKARGPSDFNLPFPFYVDEGVMAAGRDRALPNWQDVIEGPAAKFRRSSDMAGLQLADFAAFAITRSQWTIVKRKPSPAFTKAEAVILKAASALNVLNLPMRTSTSEELGRGGYEDSMSDDREAKGLSRRPPMVSQ